MAQSALTILRRYERNEDNNYHAENRVLLAKHFGSSFELAQAESLYKLQMKQGSLPVCPLYFSVTDANRRHYSRLIAAAREEWVNLPKSKRRNKPYGVE